MLQSELSSFDIAAIRTRVQGNAARAKDKQVKNPVSNPGAPDRKAHTKLGGRIADFQWMLSQGVGWYAGRSGPAKRVESGGYHRPGSMQR